MRKSTLALSLSTAVFATSTLYLGLELYGHGAAPIPIATTAGGAATAPGAARNPDGQAVPDMALAPATTQAPQAKPASSAAAPVGNSMEVDPAANAGAIFAKQQLARLKDPVQRAALLADSRAGLRRQFSRFREKFNLGDATYEQLIALLADESLQGQENFSRCAADPPCDMEEFTRRIAADDHSQELLALLGAAKLDEFNRYHASVAERDAVVQLKGRLTEGNSMRDDQTESLVAALADERSRFAKEASERGATLNGWGTNLGMIMYSNDSNSIDQRLAEAAQYSRRLRLRAGTVLSPAQLAAFNQMQDELLAQMAAYMRPSSSSRT